MLSVRKEKRRRDKYIYIYIYIYIYKYIDKVNLGTEISTTKQLSENVAQPGIEPGSPDYRSDALTTQPLNQPH